MKPDINISHLFKGKYYPFRTFCVVLLLIFLIYLFKKGTSGSFLPQSVTDHMPWWAQAEIFPERNEDVPYYAYNMLPDDEKCLYDDIYSAINHYSPVLKTDTLSENEIKKIYDAVRADHAEIYWVDGFTIRKQESGGKITRLDFVPRYTMEKKTAVAYAKKVRSCADTILRFAPVSGSDYEKSKWVYEYLFSNMTYNRDAKNNQNILSSLLYHETACRGYATAAQYLLRELGIESVIIVGTWNDTPHAWNMVKLDGDFYYMDTTLSQYYLDSNSDKEPVIDYDYLNITTQELLKQHKIDVSFLLPSCTKDKDNYYVAEHKYITTYDEAIFKEMILSAYKNGQQYFSVKFSSAALYQTYRKYLNESIASILPSDGILSYNSNPALCCIMIEFSGQ